VINFDPALGYWHYMLVNCIIDLPEKRAASTSDP